MSIRFPSRFHLAARPVRRRYTAHGRRRVRGEQGFVLALTGLLLIPLVGFTAFAVDVGSWYAQAAKMQRAADSAALAGVIWNGSPTQSGVVQAITAKSGYTDGSNGVTVTVAIPTGNPSELTVTISAPAQLYFSGVFVKAERLTRSATAQYNQPIPMGSPLGQLGNDPDHLDAADFGTTGEPGHWLDVAGWNTPKAEGDQYTSGVCRGASNPEWNCTGALSNTNTGTVASPANGDYTNQGFAYTVHYDGSSPGPLSIAIYDPAMNQQDNSCDTGGTPATGIPTAATTPSASAVAAFFGTDPNAAARYAATNNGYCTGDTAEMPTSSTPDMFTSYVVHAPVGGQQVSDFTNPAVCGITFSPHGGNGYNMGTALENPANQGVENMPFSTEYHKYVQICTIPNPVVGDYVLQVRTNAPVPAMAAVTTATTSPGTQSTIQADLGASNPTAVVAHGHNRYAIEAYYGSDPTVRTNRTGLTVGADGKLPMYVNLGLASTTTPTTTTFYLARVKSGYRGSTLQLDLWDIGDGADATITINPPSDDTGPTTPACNWSRDLGGVQVPISAAGTSATVSGAGGCTLNNLTNANFDDRMIELQIPLPGDYGCTDAGAGNDCWWTMSYSFPSGNPVDTTTWGAKILGNPVHLAQ